MKTKITDSTFKNLLTRQEYLVVQGNDLAKAFGNLSAFEHKLLDYCFSYVKKDSKYTDTFTAYSNEILKHFGLTDSGPNYEMIIKAFKRLNEKTALYIPIVDQGGIEAIIMTQLFSEIMLNKKGEVGFKFSERAMPLIFDLTSNYYSFHLSELARVKSKYTLIMLKLWRSNQYRNNTVTIIHGNSEEWQRWFLGDERTMKSAIFKRDVLNRAITDIERIFNVDVELNVDKIKNRVSAYTVTIKKLPTHTVTNVIEELDDFRSFFSISNNLN